MKGMGQNVDISIFEGNELAVHPDISLGHVSADLGGERTVDRTRRRAQRSGLSGHFQNTESGAEKFISAPRQMVNPVWFRACRYCERLPG